MSRISSMHEVPNGITAIPKYGAPPKGKSQAFQGPADLTWPEPSVTVIATWSIGNGGGMGGKGAAAMVVRVAAAGASEAAAAGH